MGTRAGRSRPQQVKIHRFGRSDPLSKLSADHGQAQYLRCYLRDLNAASVLEEPRYFDRDYLEEHAAYYASVAARYPSECRRLHFFSAPFTDALLNHALEGDSSALAKLQSAYLGFAVLRPLQHAPLGRTVVRWYPDEPARYNGNPRIVAPSRTYEVHLAGLPLRVHGLAWQQQDGAVAVCATCGLWSMLHSSAFDDHHAVPTTSDVTRFAYRSLREGAHVFPASDGLDNRQMVEAIARAHLTPVLIERDATDGFSREYFSRLCATLIRSGYPVLLSGTLEGRGGHLTCATGFREVGSHSPQQDANVRVLYVHDDNLGPNVRQTIDIDSSDHCVVLKPEAPPRRYPGKALFDPTANYEGFRPQEMIVGVHEGLHMRPEQLVTISEQVVDSLNGVIAGTSQLTATAQFIKLPRYLSEILSQTLSSNASGLGALRRRLASTSKPMGLHVGVVRIGAQRRVVADVLIDASDLAHLEVADALKHWTAFGTVLYANGYADVIEGVSQELPLGDLFTDAAT